MQCNYIDAAFGIGSLIYLYKQLQSNGRRMRLICKQGQPRDLLSILHNDQNYHLLLSIREFLAEKAFSFRITDFSTIGDLSQLRLVSHFDLVKHLH